jgi:hypothetical protein
MTQRTLTPASPPVCTFVSLRVVRMQVRTFSKQPYKTYCTPHTLWARTHTHTLYSIVHTPYIMYTMHTMYTMHSYCTLLRAHCCTAGATEMACKEGYGGPMCAVCKDGYFRSNRECKECTEPQMGLFVLFLLVCALLLIALVKLGRKYHAFLVHASAFSHFKILVSFATVVVTVDTQFGIAWPHVFASAMRGGSTAPSRVSAVSAVISGLQVLVYQISISSHYR